MTAALQQSPVKALTSRLGELKEEADRQIANLAATLKHIDETCELLNQHGLPQLPDLGEIGNAAARARRAMIADEQADTFVAPARRELNAA